MIINMGFLSNALGSVVKLAITPVAVVKDVVNVASGEKANATKDLVESAVKDAEKAMDNLCGEDELFKDKQQLNDLRRIKINSRSML